MKNSVYSFKKTINSYGFNQNCAALVEKKTDSSTHTHKLNEALLNQMAAVSVFVKLLLGRRTGSS